MTDLENSLVLTNISKQYGDRFANNNISLEVVGGRITAIVGENGAGKTNILDAISMFSPGKGIRNSKHENMVNNNSKSKTFLFK